MANNVSNQPRQPKSIALNPVGRLAHCASCTPYSAKNIHLSTEQMKSEEQKTFHNEHYF
jgi:hypothetical protein